MYSLKTRKGFPLTEVLNYTFPKLHVGKSWYVDFCAYDPSEQTMKRKKYMLDGIKLKADRRKMAAEMISALSVRLRSGWNPWVELSNTRQYVKVPTVVDMYVRYIQKLQEN